MTLRLEIPKEVEAGLLAKARAKGLSPEAYAAELLRDGLNTVDAGHAEAAKRRPAPRKSLAQVFAESPLKGLDLRFERDPDTGRPVELWPASCWIPTSHRN